MDQRTRFHAGISLGLIAIGVISLLIRLVFRMDLGISWPLALMVLGECFFLFKSFLRDQAAWSAWLTIPGCIVLMLGMIFLLNVLTQDWQSWAYAWLLLLSALGMGGWLANRDRRWPEWADWIFAGLTLLSTTFFVVFGAISSGLFFQVSTPLLLIAGGTAFYYFSRKNLLPQRQKVPLPQSSSDPDLDNPAEPNLGSGEPLTGREMEVLCLIDQGLSNTEIAERLSLAPSTVKTHINNLYSKLGVQSRIRAVHQARTLGLIKSSLRS